MSAPLVDLLLAQWDGLSWRRHGIGLLQAYVRSTNERETRVHVWDERLVRPGIHDHGDIHDHRFSFTSIVLAGSLVNEAVTSTEDPDGDYRVWQVKHARENPSGEFAARPLAAVPGPLAPSAHFVRCTFDVRVIHAGQSYSFPRGRFHRSWPARGHAVTLVTKVDQIDAGARILARRDSPPVPAFDPRDDDDEDLAATIARCLADARHALETQW